MKWFALKLLLAGLLIPATLLAQEDPVADKKTTDDTHEEIEKLKTQLQSLNKELEESQEQNRRLEFRKRSSDGALEGALDRLNELQSANMELTISLLMTVGFLLESDSANDQLMALRIMRGNPKYVKRQTSLSSEQKSKLAELTKSDDPDVKKLAIFFVNIYDQDWAIKNGLQSSDYWQSIEALVRIQGPKYAMPGLRDQLADVTDFKFVAKPLKKVLKDLKRSKLSEIEFEIDEKVNVDQLITVEASGMRLGVGLDNILSQVNSHFQVSENTIKVLSDSEPVKVELNYEVAGLLSEELTIGKLAELIQGHIGEDMQTTAEPAAETKICVTATEAKHRDVSKFLPSLAKFKN